MAHGDLNGAPTSNELRLAHGLSTGKLQVWILVCNGDYPFVTCLGQFQTFSWYQRVKRPYKDALVDVWALPMYAELTPSTFEEWSDNWLGSYTYGKRSGRLVVCLSDPKEYHSRIHYMGTLWEQLLESQDIASLGFCPECAQLCPDESLDGERFPPEHHRLIDGRCPACGWT